MELKYHKTTCFGCFFCAFMGENWMTKMAENWEIGDNICSIRHFVTEKYNFFTPLRCAYRPLKYSVIYS